WITVQRGHAIANGVPVISVNRVGREAHPPGGPGIEFCGSSFVAAAQGEILYQADVVVEETAVIAIDMERSEHVRRIWPYLRDRRIDHYDDLLKIFRD